MSARRLRWATVRGCSHNLGQDPRRTEGGQFGPWVRLRGGRGGRGRSSRLGRRAALGDGDDDRRGGGVGGSANVHPVQNQKV